jgi:peroxiredoxin Q/BCP
VTIAKEGTTAPAFATVDDSGTMVKLADFRGKWIVLFFYPKDDTPG